MHRPPRCAQAPDIPPAGFAAGFACFAAMAGDIDAAPRTAAIVIPTTHLMEGPRRFRRQKKLAKIAGSGQGTRRTECIP
jgi:hypothetical protein